MLLLAGPILASDTDLSGTWVGATEVEGYEHTATLVLKKSNGSYTGTVTDSGGYSQDTEIHSVTLQDNELSFSFQVTTPEGSMEVEMKLQIEGKKMTGNWYGEDGSSGPVELEKKS
jgi:hypothetical protein